MGSKRGTLGSVCTSWYWIYRAVVSWGGFTCSTEIELSRSHVLRDPTPHPFFRMCFRIESFLQTTLGQCKYLGLAGVEIIESFCCAGKLCAVFAPCRPRP